MQSPGHGPCPGGPVLERGACLVSRFPIAPCPTFAASTLALPGLVCPSVTHRVRLLPADCRTASCWKGICVNVCSEQPGIGATGCQVGHDLGRVAGHSGDAGDCGTLP